MIPRWMRSRWSVIVKRTKIRRTRPTTNAIATHADEHEHSGGVRDGEPGDRAEHEAGQRTAGVEADHRAPARVAVVDDLFAGMQIHAASLPPRSALHSADRGHHRNRDDRAVARVEPLTTARTLRGPFDYERPDSVGVGSVVRVPFGGRDVLGVVTSLAERSEHELSPPREVLEHSLPPDLVALAPWIAAEYCSTPARALSLMLPPKGVRARTLAACAGAARARRGRSADRRASASCWARCRALAGGDLPGAAPARGPRARGDRAPRQCAARPSHTSVGIVAAAGAPPLTDEQSAALAADRTPRSRARSCCSTA